LKEVESNLNVCLTGQQLEYSSHVAKSLSTGLEYICSNNGTLFLEVARSKGGEQCLFITEWGLLRCIGMAAPFYYEHTDDLTKCQRYLEFSQCYLGAIDHCKDTKEKGFFLNLAEALKRGTDCELESAALIAEIGSGVEGSDPLLDSTEGSGIDFTISENLRLGVPLMEGSGAEMTIAEGSGFVKVVEGSGYVDNVTEGSGYVESKEDLVRVERADYDGSGFGESTVFVLVTEEPEYKGTVSSEADNDSSQVEINSGRFSVIVNTGVILSLLLCLCVL